MPNANATVSTGAIASQPSSAVSSIDVSSSELTDKASTQLDADPQFSTTLALLNASNVVSAPPSLARQIAVTAVEQEVAASEATNLDPSQQLLDLRPVEVPSDSALVTRTKSPPDPESQTQSDAAAPTDTVGGGLLFQWFAMASPTPSMTEQNRSTSISAAVIPDDGRPSGTVDLRQGASLGAAATVSVNGDAANSLAAKMATQFALTDSGTVPSDGNVDLLTAQMTADPTPQSAPTHFEYRRYDPAEPLAAVRVASPQWVDSLGDHLTWMVDRGEQVATLKLTPAHLGPLEVRITVRDNAATVWFGAAHPDTRHALEQALPQLRDMLAAQGIALGQSGVHREGTPPSQSRNTTHGKTSSAAVTDGQSELPRPALITLGLVDLYA